MTQPSLVVLAAGMGSRYGGLKQIAPVNRAGETIVDYSVYDAMRAGFGHVVFVIRRDIEDAFKATVGVKFSKRVQVSYAFQDLHDLPPGFTPPGGRTRPWGTLQATLRGASTTDGRFAVINADDFYGAGSYRALTHFWQHSPAAHAMAGFRLRQTLSRFGAVSRGICEVGADSLLRTIVERTKIVPDGDGARTVEDGTPPLHFSGDELVSMNMWGFAPSIKPLLDAAFINFLQTNASSPKAEAYLPEAVNTIMSTGKAAVHMLPTADTWCGMTYPEDHPHVVETIAALTRQGEYPDRLWP